MANGILRSAESIRVRTTRTLLPLLGRKDQASIPSPGCAAKYLDTRVAQAEAALIKGKADSGFTVYKKLLPSMLSPFLFHLLHPCLSPRLAFSDSTRLSLDHRSSLISPPSF